MPFTPGSCDVRFEAEVEDVLAARCGEESRCTLQVLRDVQRGSSTSPLTTPHLLRLLWPATNTDGPRSESFTTVTPKLQPLRFGSDAALFLLLMGEGSEAPLRRV